MLLACRVVQWYDRNCTIPYAAAVRLAKNPEFHKRTQYINLKQLYVSEKLIAQYVPLEFQLANLHTKPLNATSHFFVTFR